MDPRDGSYPSPDGTASPPESSGTFLHLAPLRQTLACSLEKVSFSQSDCKCWRGSLTYILMTVVVSSSTGTQIDFGFGSPT